MNKQIYKNYKYDFEKLRNKAKQTSYQILLKGSQNVMNHTWQIMKERRGITKQIF